MTDAIEAGECCKQTDLGFPMVELVVPPANFTHNDC